MLKFAHIFFGAMLAVFMFACSLGSAPTSERPHWTLPGFIPEVGIVRSNLRHVQGLAKTRAMLLDEAMLEMSKQQFGSEIALNTQVTKSTQVYNNDRVESQVLHSDTAQITTANNTALVKAQVKSEWYDTTSERLYLWVIPSP